jgi:hypothetical protein
MLEKDGFVVVGQLNKQFLVRITSVSKSGDTFRGMIENGKDEGADIEAAVEDVKAYLGAHPDLGRVFSASTIRLVRVDSNAVFDSISWYWETEDELREKILKEVKVGYKTLKAKGLSYLCDILTLSFERVPKALTAKTIIGMYKGNRHKDSDRPDEIVLKWHPELPDGAITDTFYHETGHGFWNRAFNDALRARWMLQYVKSTTIDESFVQEDILAACKAMWENDLTASNEREEAILANVAAQLNSIYGLRWKDILLLYHTQPAKLRGLIKVVSAFGGCTSTRDTHITEYAGKTVEEYWCEAWRVFLSGRTLPESLEELMEDTYNHLKGQRLNIASPDSDDDDD